MRFTQARIPAFLLGGLAVLGAAGILTALPPEGDYRIARENGWIYDDFEAALARARETGKPLFVVLRCPP